MNWNDWATGVLHGIGAPSDQTNFDTLWAWSGAESGTARMRWNNPLNTTQPEGAGNRDANKVGVKIYPTGEQGISATVITLLNGRYGIIVDHLRSSIPRAHWQDACPELGVWGTGCSWLTADYGAAPQSLGEDEMNATDFKALVILAYVAASGNRRSPETQAAIDGWAKGYNGSNGDQIIATIVNQPEFLTDRAKANAEDKEVVGGDFAPKTHTHTTGPAI